METPQKRILILAANPSDTVRLRLDHEYRDIEETLRKSQLRDSIHVKYAPAARPEDLQQQMLDFKPHIVQFSGHGYEGGVVVERPAGGATSITAETLACLLGTLQGEQSADKI